MLVADSVVVIVADEVVVDVVVVLEDGELVELTVLDTVTVLVTVAEALLVLDTVTVEVAVALTEAVAEEDPEAVTVLVCV